MVNSLWGMEEDLFRRFDELRRELEELFPWSGFAPAPAIRAARATFPLLNIGATEDAVYVYAFAPGIDPEKVELTMEGNVLTISGERELGERESEGRTVYLQERYRGPFRRVVTLPEEVDPERVSATYKNGVLLVQILKKGAKQPKKIQVQVA